MIEKNEIRCDNLLALAKFSEKLMTFEMQDQMFDYIIDSVLDIFKCDQALLMTLDFKTRKIQTMKGRGFDTINFIAPRIVSARDATKWGYDGGEVFALTVNEKNKFLIIFDRDESKYFNCEIRIPLFNRNNIVSILNIGKKSKSTEYSEQDITLLRIFATLATLAIDNAITSQKSIFQKKREHEVSDNLAQKNILIKCRVQENRMIGQSEAINQIQDVVERIATKDVSVMITGESGTGKDLVARSIHQKSFRRDKPFVAMNCAALPENLVESELFGHEKGAFTGAHAQKKGKFEYADGGTLFLDEIGDMSLHTQAKLLRVLEDGTFQRTGSNATLKSDVRIVAATNKNIRDEILSGNFREDLYYRINVVQIFIPPLRERREDIPVLAKYFFEKFKSFYNKEIKKIANNSMTRLVEYDFPGNVRELQNIIERAVIMELCDTLSIDFIPRSIRKYEKAEQHDIDGSLMELEKEHIKRVLNEVNFNKSHAAKILGIARKTLREKIQRYGLNKVIC